MQESLADHIENAGMCMRRMETLLAGAADPSKVKAFSTIVKEALSHLEQASKAAFQHEVHFALSPDCFNPFNLLDVERAFSRLALHESGQTMIVLKHVEDHNPEVESRPAGERMGDIIVVYTISSDAHAESFAFHGITALTSYQEDEADLQKTSPGSEPLVANYSIRRRLLAAKSPPPGELDLENVAKVVADTLGKNPVKAHITTRTWYCLSKKYVLDIVCVHALIEARRHKFEVPSVGDRRDLWEEDPLCRYLGLEGWNDLD